MVQVNTCRNTNKGHLCNVVHASGSSDPKKPVPEKKKKKKKTDLKKVDISKPRWDQNTFMGRLKHYICVTNPLNLFVSNKQLEEAKDIVTKHRAKKKLNLTEDELWRAKQLYDSAYHPVTGEKQFPLGRMSAQVFGNTLIAGFMMTFYKSTPAVIFWQWINQSFNAIVNYENRSDADMSRGQIVVAYVCATTAAVSTALGLNKTLKKSNPLVRRLVPFMAVAAANCVNIPIMRNKELKEGIKIFNEKEVVLGKSQYAAILATIQVIISRIIMASPAMVLIPIAMRQFDKRDTFCKRPWLEPLVASGICGVVVILATPLACALFIQRSPVRVDSLEEELQEVAKKKKIKKVYYNKGL